MHPAPMAATEADFSSSIERGAFLTRWQSMQLPLTTKAMGFLGSFCKGLYRNHGQATKQMVLVVQGHSSYPSRVLEADLDQPFRGLYPKPLCVSP